MGWTTPTSPAAGSAATSTWADIVAADLIFLAQKPYATVASTVGTSVTNTTWTQITVSTQSAQYGMTTGSNNITVPTTAVYEVHAFVAWNQVSATLLSTGVYVNGVLVLSTQVGTQGAGAGAMLSGIISVTAGQTVGLYGQQNSGGTVTTATTGSYLHLMMTGLV